MRTFVMIVILCAVAFLMLWGVKLDGQLITLLETNNRIEAKLDKMIGKRGRP